MRIHYWHDEIKCPQGNFGDQLNIWLWPQLIPEVIEADDNSVLVGIGTILNLEVPTNKNIAVFGAGVGYGAPPQLSKNWKIYCVRGPRTATALNLDPALAITDAAILVRACVSLDKLKAETQDTVAFMPHWQTPNCLWKQACEEEGIKFIDPSEPIPVILKKIANARLVLAEAMHGAIVADALRTPWIAVSTHISINSFKWVDWCESMQMKYDPANLYWKRFAPQSIHTSSPFARLATVSARLGLRRVIKIAQPKLSMDKISQNREQQLFDKLEQLRKDWAQGHFAK